MQVYGAFKRFCFDYTANAGVWGVLKFSFKITYVHTVSKSSVSPGLPHSLAASVLHGRHSTLYVSLRVSYSVRSLAVASSHSLNASTTHFILLLEKVLKCHRVIFGIFLILCTQNSGIPNLGNPGIGHTIWNSLIFGFQVENAKWSFVKKITMHRLFQELSKNKIWKKKLPA